MPIPSSRLRALLNGCLVLAACADPVSAPEPPGPVERGEPDREWMFGVFPPNRTNVLNGPPRDQLGGVVSDEVDFGPDFGAPVPDGRSRAKVFSSADGATYSVSTERNNTRVTLQQFQRFRKRSPNAFLRFVVTRAELRAGISNNTPVERDCLELQVRCLTEAARVSLEIKAWKDTGSQRIISWQASEAAIRRSANRWYFETDAVAMGAGFLWSNGDFTRNFPGGADHRSPTASLVQPKVVRVDLSAVGLEEQFTVRTVAIAENFKGGGGETFAHAYLKDPAGVGGTVVEYEGLDPIPDPTPEPTSGIFGEAPPCAGPNGGGGTLQFSRAVYREDELPAAGIEQVTVTRTGGSSGPVSATVTTSDGTAVAGRDYTAVLGTVAFADGDTTPRTVRVPIVLDTVAEPDKALGVRLSNVRGCATLGRSDATLTITDDDRPPIATAFPVGGTVTGLVGSGLVLRNTAGGEEMAVPNAGTFAFTRPTVTGLLYGVVVATQPSNPAQVCTVTNGSGTMGSAPVTNVAVTCTTQQAVSGLDPSFGTNGRASTPLGGGRGEAVAVQPDGKIVVAGKASVSPGGGAPAGADFMVQRYLPNGTLDPAFGTGGTATVGFPAGRTDEAFDVALQADGKIVVVGRTQTAGPDFDFGVARLNADGTPDAGFGSGGRVTADFGPGSGYAQAVAVQPDGRIVVAGHHGSGLGNDFALARFNADGTPDPTFGGDGRVTTDFAARTDLAFAVALGAGGKIVAAGRSDQGGLRRDDFGVARYNADGTLDQSFGAGGLATTDLGGGSQQANDVAVLADGRVVVAGYSSITGTGAFDYALARFTNDGRLDTSFGSAGTATADLSGNDDFAEGLAVQADGRLVLVGRRTGTGFFDLALTRHNADGTPDVTFGTGGRVVVDFFGASDEGQGIAVQPDGRLVAVGETRNGSAPHVALVRVVP